MKYIKFLIFISDILRRARETESGRDRESCTCCSTLELPLAHVRISLPSEIQPASSFNQRNQLPEALFSLSLSLFLSPSPSNA